MTLDDQERMDRTEEEVLKVISENPVLLDLQDREAEKDQQVLQDSPEHKYKGNLYRDHQDQGVLMEIQESLEVKVKKESEGKGEIKEERAPLGSLEVYTYFLEDSYIFENIL